VHALLVDLLRVTVVVFAVASMLAVGLTYSVRQILAPLRDARLVALSVGANFLLVPAWALLLVGVLDLAEPYRIGLLVVATAAGAPFVVKLVMSAGGDLAFAASLLVLLLPVTVVYMPLVVPLVAPDAEVGPGAVAAPLVTTNLLPLVAGMVVLALVPGVARRLRPLLRPLTTAALLAVLALTMAAYWEEFAGLLGRRVILATLLLVAGAFLIGFALARPQRHRNEFGLAAAQRNIAAATVVATQSIGHPDTVVTVIVASVVSMLLFPLAWQLRRRRR
jgi:bile acid:Na+ symporter, BASS family